MNKYKKNKRKRVDIATLEDFIKCLLIEGYEINKENYKEKVKDIFNVSNEIIDKLNYCINNNISYRVYGSEDFINYVSSIVIYEKEYESLCSILMNIDELIINRVEYEREICIPEDVEHIIKAINEVKNHISSSLNYDEELIIEQVEKDIEAEYLFSKDIEVLKNILNKNIVFEDYNEESYIKTYIIKIPDKIDVFYSKFKEGTVEYYMYLESTIPRIKRLIRNLHKYIYRNEGKARSYIINQSSALQDSINIAVAKFNNIEFKAISGSNDVFDYCKSPKIEKAKFMSTKVNRLGEIGVGYNRVNDSEKKILEEIHREIENSNINNSGELIIFTKWEPCPSCYYVISQFINEYPNIDIKVKYNKRYGER